MRSVTNSSSSRINRILAPIFTFAILFAIVGFTFLVNDPAVGAEPALVAFPQPGAYAEVLPISIDGTVLGMRDGRLAIQERNGSAPVAFPVALGLSVTRAGVETPVDALQPGDRIAMTIDGRTGTVLRADAHPAASSAPFAPSGESALLAALGLIGAGVLLATRRRGAPARIVPGRVSLAPAAARI